jgi:Flp pilus assembly protein TadG
MTLMKRRCSVSTSSLVRRRCGQSLLETSLLAPMLLFLFLGMVDFGWYVYSFIQVGNAARVAAEYLATKGAALQTCGVVLREMKTMANVASLSPTYNCSAVAPVKVITEDCKVAINGTVTCPAGTVTAPETRAWRVTVKYETIALFRLPFMAGKMVIGRQAVMRKMGLGV